MVFPAQTSLPNRCLLTVLCAQASVELGGETDGDETDVEVTATLYLSYWTKVVFDLIRSKLAGSVDEYTPE